MSKSFEEFLAKNAETYAAAAAELQSRWAQEDARRGQELCEKYASIEEAYFTSEEFVSRKDLRLLCGAMYPEQKVMVCEKTGSAQVSETAGLPRSSDREPYSTLRDGTVYYFHASTLKKGKQVEWDGRIWEVLFNYLNRDKPESLAYQCIYLLEVAQLLPE